MRLLLVSEDPTINGGIPRYSQPVAEALAARRARVDYVFTGGCTGRYDWRLRRRWLAWAQVGVRYHGLVNPRSIGVPTAKPELDVEGDDSDWIAARARALAPDVIHVHSLLGIPVETLSLLADLAPLVVSFHEFGLVCQRRVLVQRDMSACATYAEQSDCPACVDTVEPRRYRLRARLANTAGGLPLSALHAAERLAGADVTVARTAAGGAVDTSAPFRLRLARSVELVNAHVSRALAVSNSVRDILVGVGVSPDLLSVMHIGSGSAERLPRLPLPSRDGRPVTFLFLGGLVPNKGAHVLMDALVRLPDPPRVIVSGRGSATYIAGLRQDAPPSVEFRGGYGPAELLALLGEGDVLVAPTVGPDTSPQVVLEALAAGRPVIASRIGGLPDFVRDRVNGRLFEPGDAGDLARTMVELRDHDLVAALAANACLHRRLSDHVSDLEALYAEIA